MGFIIGASAPILTAVSSLAISAAKTAVALTPRVIVGYSTFIMVPY